MIPIREDRTGRCLVNTAFTQYHETEVSRANIARAYAQLAGVVYPNNGKDWITWNSVQLEWLAQVQRQNAAALKRALA